MIITKVVYMYKDFVVYRVVNFQESCKGKEDALLSNQEHYEQGFIQAILISVRRHKKLKLKFKFNLHKFYFKACWY